MGRLPAGARPRAVTPRTVIPGTVLAGTVIRGPLSRIRLCRLRGLPGRVRGFRDPGYQEPGHGESGYPGPGYPEPGYSDTGYPGSRSSGRGLPDSGHPDPGRHDPGYADSGHDPDSGRTGPGFPDPGYPGGAGDEGWYGAETDGFRLPPVTGDDPWDDGDGYEADPQDEPARRTPLLAVLFPRRESRDRDEGGSRTFVSSAQRLGGILLAGASVVGVAFYVPSILAADSRSFTGVVSNSGLASLNFGVSGRVGRVLVHLGQAVRREKCWPPRPAGRKPRPSGPTGPRSRPTRPTWPRCRPTGPRATSIAAAQAQLAKDRARRAADRMKLSATEIVAPRSGTVVAIDGQPGDTVSPAGLSGSAAHAQASPGQQPRFSLLPSGPMASLRAAGLALPVIALRTGGGWQVRLLIPQTDTSAVKVGGKVTISVPAAQLSGVKGTIGERVAHAGGQFGRRQLRSRGAGDRPDPGHPAQRHDRQRPAGLVTAAGPGRPGARRVTCEPGAPCPGAARPGSQPANPA